MPNMRIIYNNIVDLSSTSITASTTQSTATPVTNMASDTKSKVWRSGSTTTASTNVTAMLAVSCASTAVSGVVLPFTNLNSSTATIRVLGYTGTNASVGGTANAPTFTAGGTLVFDTGAKQCCPWNSLGLYTYGNNPQGATTYAYGGGTYARVWFNSATVTSLIIVITDNYSTSASGRFIEVSKLVIGNYWSPTYNIGFGLSTGMKDLSSSDRTEAGDLVTRRGPKYNVLNFNMQYIHTSDRVNLSKIFASNGSSRAMLVSLFPDNTSDWEKERVHMVYGKLSALPGLSFDNPFTYSTSIDLEEV